MKKFAVFSGFLGSGKTTTMMALTRYTTAHHAKAAMISNDLGTGVTLADDRLARLSGVNASQITDPCTDIAVVLNANAACPAKVLDEIILGASTAASQKYQLEIRLFKKECFNLGEE